VPTVRELAERGGRGALSSCGEVGSLAEIRCRFSADQSVKDIRVEVGAVRPADRAKLRVDPNAGEYLRIAQRCEDTLERHDRRNVDFALGSFETKPQTTVAHGFHLDDILEHDSTPKARSD
jgi:hypothetical protein